MRYFPRAEKLKEELYDTGKYFLSRHKGLAVGIVGGIATLACVAGIAIGSLFYRPREIQPTQPPRVIEKVITSTPYNIPTPEIVTKEVVKVVTATSEPNPTPAYTHMDGPFREHQKAAIGSGPLTNVTYSDGMAPYSDEWLATNHYSIQLIRMEDYPDGCGVSIYDTNKIWFGCAMLTTLIVNDEPVADLYVPTGSHGYIVELPLKVGDKICVTDFNKNGFHIYFGPDLYYHYDSYCYRGRCR